MKYDDSGKICICYGEFGIREYSIRCGEHVMSYFRFFDQHILDIDGIRKKIGVQPVVMYTSHDIQRLDFNRVVSYNRIKIRDTEDVWLQSFCHRILPAWIGCRRTYDIEVSRLHNVPDIAEYLQQEEWEWVRQIFQRKP